ncbi:MAG: hypothetical protein JW837_02420 [Sedimentisphaerales bacterium]|nr:hypothetical protein [Sedimentisphaerales bacterium]
MPVSWLELASAAFTGGIVVKLLDIAYIEYKSSSSSSKAAKDLLDKYLDPILKSADELLGKLISLAKEDFKSLYENNGTEVEIKSQQVKVVYVLYLFTHFWSQLAILRKESINENLVSQKEGKTLLKFIATLESKRSRIVDRALQRGIGDSIVENEEGILRSKTFYMFFEEYSKEGSSLREWLEPLREILINTSQKEVRQQVLFYGIILHALIDTFDLEHKYLKDRSAYPNKLTESRRRDLRYRIFREYLPMVRNDQKYWNVPKKKR